MKKVIFLILTLFYWGIFSSFSQPIKLAIIHYSDLHGHLESFNKSKFTSIGGLTYLADYINLIKEIEQLKGYNKIFVVNDGDIFQKSAYGAIFKGKATISLLNLSPLDILVPGNHEFDLDMNFVKKLPHKLKAKVICANLYYTDKKRRIYRPLLKYPLSSNQNLYFIGLTTPSTNQAKSPKLEGKIYFTPMIKEMEKLKRQFKIKPQDIVIILAHEEQKKLKQLANNFPHLIDFILGGHDHKVYQIEENKIPIVNSGKYGMYLTLVEADFSPTGILKFHKERLFPIGNRKIAHQLNRWRKKLEKKTNQIIIENNPITLKSKKDSKIPMPLNYLIAHIFKETTGSQISFINAGGIRSKLKKGSVTIKDILEIFPYDNYLVTFQLTGTQLKKLVLLSLKKRGTNGFLHFDGLKIYLKNNQLYRLTTKEGKDIENSQIYTISTTDFLMTGGDGYKFLEKIPYQKIKLARDTIIEWLTQHKPPYPKPDWLIEE